jgi:hypothetical protein
MWATFGYEFRRFLRPSHRAADTRDRSIEAFYTNNKALLATLQSLVVGPLPAKRIILIRGTGGVGLSSLLRMFRRFCIKEPHVCVGLTEGTAVVEVLRRLADDLHTSGLRLPRFRRRLKRYDRMQAKAVDNANEQRRHS